MYNLLSFFLSKVIFCSSFVCPQNRVFGGGVTVSGIEPCRAAEVLPTAFESASLSSIKSFNQWIESLIDRIDLSESEAAASLDFLLNEPNEALISAFLHEDIVIRNLDFILTFSPQSIANTSPDVLANLEKLLDDRSSEAWSSQPLPTSEEEEKDELTQHNSKEVRALRKRLQQIEILEAKQSRGQLLDGQQIAELQKKLDIESSLVELGIPVEESPEAKSSTALPLDGKANKKGKKKKKGKQRSVQIETFPDFGEVKDGKTMLDMKMISGFPKESDFVSLSQKKDNPSDSPISKKLAMAANKKKNSKGGLSMFLTGALDDIPKPVVAPLPKPKVEGPVWGGAKISKGLSSLQDIQDEQSKTRPHEPLFDVGKRTPPWASSETSRNLSRPSLRDIQMQEVKMQQSLSHSPKTKTPGFTVATGQGSPSDFAWN
ncbi:hypothetical protein ISN45_Aa03g003840 [Arabidopsis thaliana x Arabidopsis arenosa]|uniref:Uncharacterized protein n=1 Tax=Arabidopsis thaliana x Arabidopsis arenosa TaxID=1240361 RepID=A0A8T2ASG8_9BRAS|nr:hypothetical protein ISN45_Aa03g003840 [Arabidopsis thaliana x Arabidopsis arenosa]